MSIVKTIILTSMIACCSCDDSCKVWIENNEMDLGYNGIVEKKYIDYKDRAGLRVILNDKQKCYINNQLIFDKIQPGDVLFKNPGTLVRFLIQKDDTIAYYQQCGDGNDVK